MGGMVFRKITIINVRQAPTNDVNEQLQIIGGTLGLFSLRDKDKSCFRIFITLLHSLRHGHGLSSDEIALLTGLSRGTVVFHLNKLMASGIVEPDHGRYLFTFDSIEELVERVEQNVHKTLAELKDTAKGVDQQLNLY